MPTKILILLSKKNYISKINFYALSKPKSNFEGWMTFESFFKDLRPDTSAFYLFCFTYICFRNEKIYLYMYQLLSLIFWFPPIKGRSVYPIEIRDKGRLCPHRDVCPSGTPVTPVNERTKGPLYIYYTRGSTTTILWNITMEPHSSGKRIWVNFDIQKRF